MILRGLSNDYHYDSQVFPLDPEEYEVWTSI